MSDLAPSPPVSELRQEGPRGTESEEGASCVMTWVAQGWGARVTLNPAGSDSEDSAPAGPCSRVTLSPRSQVTRTGVPEATGRFLICKQGK